MSFIAEGVMSRDVHLSVIKKMDGYAVRVVSESDLEKGLLTHFLRLIILATKKYGNGLFGMHMARRCRI